MFFKVTVVILLLLIFIVQVSMMGYVSHIPVA